MKTATPKERNILKAHKFEPVIAVVYLLLLIVFYFSGFQLPGVCVLNACVRCYQSASTK